MTDIKTEVKTEVKEKRTYVKSGRFTKEARLARLAELQAKRKEDRTETKRKRRAPLKIVNQESTPV